MSGMIEKMSLVRVVGFLVLLFGLSCFMLVWLNREAAANGGRDLLHPFTEFGVLSIALGIGLLRESLSAIRIVAAVSIGIGGWLCLGSLFTMPMPYALLNIMMGGPLVATGVLMMRRRDRSRKATGSIPRA